MIKSLNILGERSRWEKRTDWIQQSLKVYVWMKWQGRASVMTQACFACSWGRETAGYQVWGQPELHINWRTAWATCMQKLRILCDEVKEKKRLLRKIFSCHLHLIRYLLYSSNVSHKDWQCIYDVRVPSPSLKHYIMHTGNAHWNSSTREVEAKG